MELNQQNFLIQIQIITIYDYSNCSPTFGDGHAIYTNKDEIYSNFPSSAYQDILGKGKSIFAGDLNNNNMYFNLK